MNDKKNDKSLPTLIGECIGQLIAFFLLPFIMLKLWAALAVAFTLPVFSYWFWLGVTYVIQYFINLIKNH